jgi:hypothetical protein
MIDNKEANRIKMSTKLVNKKNHLKRRVQKLQKKVIKNDKINEKDKQTKERNRNLTKSDRRIK